MLASQSFTLLPSGTSSQAQGCCILVYQGFSRVWFGFNHLGACGQLQKGRGSAVLSPAALVGSPQSLWCQCYGAWETEDSPVAGSVCESGT